MGWAEAISSARMQDRIRNLEDELSMYREKYGFIGFNGVSGYEGSSNYKGSSGYDGSLTQPNASKTEGE